MPLAFTKMHGLGNDYVYVALFKQRVADAPALARAISDRHRGVGGDGLILIAPPDADGADVRMIMYNADGSRAQMCGNGIRCVAKLAYERGWAPGLKGAAGQARGGGDAAAPRMRIATDAGVLTLDLHLDDAGRVAAVRVDMGVPVLAPREIPVALDGERLVAAPLALADQQLRMTCVSLGNPHAVFFVEDVARVPLEVWGPAIERHPLFPQRVNAHFAQVLGPQRVRMRTWERGAGATQACGTGACAVCVAAVLEERTRRQITAELPGGALALAWDADTNHVFKTGPAVEVFTGVWPD